MLRIVSTLTLGLLVLSGCPGDDTGTTAAGSSTDPGDTTAVPATDTNPGTTIGESADTTEGATTNTPGTTTDDPPGTTTDEPPGTTTDEPPGTTTDEPPGTTTDGPGGVCEPDPAGDECGECVKDQCCPELEACGMDADCTCFQDCAEMNPGVPGAIACAGDCGISLLELQNAGTIVGALAVCTQENCPVCVM